MTCLMIIIYKLTTKVTYRYAYIENTTNNKMAKCERMLQLMAHSSEQKKQKIIKNIVIGDGSVAE